MMEVAAVTAEIVRLFFFLPQAQKGNAIPQVESVKSIWAFNLFCVIRLR